jgi:hypothetical protein
MPLAPPRASHRRTAVGDRRRAWESTTLQEGAKLSPCVKKLLVGIVAALGLGLVGLLARWTVFFDAESYSHSLGWRKLEHPESFASATGPVTPHRGQGPCLWLPSEQSGAEVTATAAELIAAGVEAVPVDEVIDSYGVWWVKHEDSAHVGAVEMAEVARRLGWADRIQVWLNTRKLLAESDQASRTLETQFARHARKWPPGLREKVDAIWEKRAPRRPRELASEIRRLEMH